MKKKFKKAIAVILTVAMAMSVGAPAFAADVEPLADGYYYWKVESTGTRVAAGHSLWEVVYEGYPAQADGEVDTISKTISVGVEVSGTMNVSAASIRAAVGVGTSVEVGLGVSKSTRALNRGEYVIASMRGVLYETPVIQREYFRIDGYDTPTSNTATAYCKAALPLGQIKLEYFMDPAYARNIDGSNEPFMVEYYEVNSAGELELLYVEK